MALYFPRRAYGMGDRWGDLGGGLLFRCGLGGFLSDRLELR